MTHLASKAAIVFAALLLPAGVLAQTETPDTSDLLQPDELETLVEPVALYPDTLLIQVLVAATFPLEVIKADQMVGDNIDTPAEELKPLLEDEGWDESVTVLATAFPDVLDDMATHIDWTETVGNAMLAQSDDLMTAVQTQRQIANEAGNLASGDEQTVEVTQEGDEETIIIQPTDPEVVYVPQYDPETVYVENPNSGVNDAVTTGLLVFGTAAIMNEIFDDDDPWNDYWGCHNCGGWNGQPPIRNPDIDIDIDGNVNIGDRNNAGWKPDERRQKDARNEISRKRGKDGKTNMPVKKPDRGDQMRANLTRQTGAADISRSKNPKAGVQRPTSLPSADRKAAVNRTAAPRKSGTQAPKAKTAHKPKAKAKAAPKRKAASHNGSAMKKRAPSHKASAGASRGRKSSGGRKRR